METTVVHFEKQESIWRSPHWEDDKMMDFQMFRGIGKSLVWLSTKIGCIQEEIGRKRLKCPLHRYHN